MSIDEQHVALPRLYGAPAYARPPAPVATTPRPFDPDDLPIEAVMSEEERSLAATLPARSWAPGGTMVATGHQDVRQAEPTLRARPFSLRRIAGRLLGSD